MSTSKSIILILLCVFIGTLSFECPKSRLYPDPKSCAHFFECVNGQATRKACSNDQFYNQDFGGCETAAKCSTTNSRQDFECPEFKLYPDPTNCERFFKCVGRQATIMVCPEGQRFNKDAQSCDRSHMATCSSTNSHLATYKIACQFIDSLRQGRTNTMFTPSQIDPFLCTHINFNVASLDKDSQTIHFMGPYENEGHHKEVMELKKRNPSLKVMLSLGGYSDFSKLTANETARNTFSSYVVEFLKKYDFDGLDFNLKNPGCRKGECVENSSEKENLASLLQELRVKFDEQKPRLLLSAAVSSSNYYIDQAYDVPTFASALDIINVLSFDYTNSVNNVTAPNAALTAVPGMDPSLTVAAAMMNWQMKGAPANKLNLGIPAYGVSFTLKNSDCHSFDSPAEDSGKPGPITNIHGELVYSEICQYLKDGWNKGGNDNEGSFAYSRDQWVGYDDPNTVARKAKFIVDHGYGGASIFSLSLDDFNGGCCGIKYPLTSVVNNVLNGTGKPLSDVKCQ